MSKAVGLSQQLLLSCLHNDAALLEHAWRAALKTVDSRTTMSGRRKCFRCDISWFATLAAEDPMRHSHELVLDRRCEKAGSPN
jgi:hypothetical protein